MAFDKDWTTFIIRIEGFFKSMKVYCTTISSGAVFLKLEVPMLVFH